MNIHSSSRQRNEHSFQTGRTTKMKNATHMVEDPHDKKQAILAAALDLFAVKGYHGTAVPEIAEAAKVGAGTVYRYFQSKEQLVNELYRNWKMALFTALMNDFPVDKTPR